MTRPRSGTRRAILTAGALLAASMMLTAAAFTDQADVAVQLDGSRNTLDIVVTGGVGEDPDAWNAETADWQQGRPGAVRLGVGSQLISPGGEVRALVAVKNASPVLAADLTLTISDPLPRGAETDPATGAFVELFDQLVFTVAEVGGGTLIDRVPAAELSSYTWPAAFAAGESRALEVTMELPESVDNRWQLASTDVLFSFTAVQS
ncbi:hypothetical protein [Microbacterium sp. SORGH_AS_0888]|uniref:hypothetical protein n=1 Tax=Microbacterium sp. SORGH_AS_0888 TaxID=3041791 RepID=UPI00278A7753|nr:hypothetical protein [Microbacterium sp. SORGH_AS_0888]MDQ1129967.1 hypothetical protein [Microbacterium sp. SORGH_AS_0888]